MYRVEIFDLLNKKFRSSCFASENQTIRFDYISPEIFEFKCPKTEAEILDGIRISQNNIKVFEGYISAVEFKEDETILSVAPFLKLVDVPSVQNSTLKWSEQIYNQIRYDFMQRTPNLYKLPFEFTGNLNSWGNVQKVYSEVLESDMKCIILAAEVFGKYMNFELTSDFDIGFSFLETPSKITVEADLNNIVNKEINISSDAGYNIRMIWYPIDETKTNYNHRQAYLLPNGTVSYNHADSYKVINPRLKAKTIDKDFETEDEAQKALLEMLKPESSNNEIILTVKKSDKIINAFDMQIGQPLNVIYKGIIYESVLSGKNYNGDLIDLICGGVRNELTKKLQRR